VASTLNGTILRLDDRRIHGQILYGWGVGWPADEIWLVDRAVANDARERVLYDDLITESGSVGGVLAPDEAGLRLSTLQHELPRAKRLVVFSEPEVLNDLVQHDLRITEIDLAHRAKEKGRRKVAARVFLAETEIELLDTFRAKKVHIVHRDLPGDEAIAIDVRETEGGDREQ
jgi:mannose/fructose/N-acetylgalactosamine-specific phosphotransferase system component IIB